MPDLTKVIVSEMLWAKYNAQFAIKVSDIISKRNPEGKCP